MSALFIGRFQPFHLGHLDAIKQALAELKKPRIQKSAQLFIVIGSAQENHTPQNPLTSGERIQMIQAALDEAKIPRTKYLIIPIPDINNNKLWPSHVEKYLPPFHKIFTGSEIIKTLFKNENKSRKNPWEIIEIKKNLKISSTIVREKMLKNKNWEELTPKSVAKLLKRWSSHKRLKSINKSLTSK